MPPGVSKGSSGRLVVTVPFVWALAGVRTARPACVPPHLSPVSHGATAPGRGGGARPIKPPTATARRARAAADEGDERAPLRWLLRFPTKRGVAVAGRMIADDDRVGLGWLWFCSLRRRRRTV